MSQNDPCNGSGIVTWHENGIGYWRPCECEAGKKLSAEIERGERDIAEGRFSKWTDVKRKHGWTA